MVQLTPEQEQQVKEMFFRINEEIRQCLPSQIGYHTGIRMGYREMLQTIGLTNLQIMEFEYSLTKTWSRDKL